MGDCNQLFGSLPWAMYTWFQVLTLESWSQAIARPVIEVKPELLLVFVMFLFLSTFGLLNIIVGVIVENTLNSAKQNIELQNLRMELQLRKELQALRSLFEEADEDGSGEVDRSEFC